jgi:flagellar hook-basal body complex protein FliE
MPSTISFSYTSAEDSDTEEQLSQMLKEFIHAIMKEKEKADATFARKASKKEQTDVILPHTKPKG